MTYRLEHPMVFAETYGAGRQDQRWVLVLNPYQRDNLLQVLNACGYGARDAQGEASAGVAPFTALNNGDWVGEIAWMLADREDPANIDAERGGRPNTTREALTERIRGWLAREGKGPA